VSIEITCDKSSAEMKVTSPLSEIGDISDMKITNNKYFLFITN
jgi:hypothetical protein